MSNVMYMLPHIQKQHTKKGDEPAIHRRGTSNGQDTWVKKMYTDNYEDSTLNFKISEIRLISENL